MTAIISRATVVGGHDGRAEIEVEMTYDNGGTATISLDAEACTASLDEAGVASIDDLVGQPWSVVLPAIRPSRDAADDASHEPGHQPGHEPGTDPGPARGTHARSHHP